MSRLYKLLAIIFVFIGAHDPVACQQNASRLSAAADPTRTTETRTIESTSFGRIKVGVALSGGAALGLAHIGVIRYFEEHRIPIDLIAGTSMGGLVGGLYATGLDSEKLSSIAEHADWDRLLNPTPQYRDRPIVEKQSWNQSFGNLTLRLGRRFSLPQGINPGEALSILLSRHTAAYGNVPSFDDLPTPFRCVATDLINSDAVVLDHGSLAKAMRATMSLPAIFTPVRWEGKLLVDGGLVQNLPVEVVKSMGAERTIAVALQAERPKAKDLTSLTSIALRSVSVAVEQNERRSAALADVVIVVDARKFASSDYARSQDIIQAGYEAAQAKATDLKAFEVGVEEWRAYLQGRKRKATGAPTSAPILSVTASDPSFRENAKYELSRKLGTGPVPVAELEDTLSGMVAATGVPGASYRWDQRSRGYQVEFLERQGESILIRPSFSFGTSSGEPSQAALRLSLSRIGADAYKSRTLATATVGYDPGLRIEYYRPVGGTGYFFAPGALIERMHINTYSGPVRSAQTRDRFGASMYAGIGTWRFVQFRAGLLAGYDSYSKQLEADGVVARSHGFANPEVTWIYNTLDSGGLPNEGTRIEGSGGYSFRNVSFPYLRNDMTTFVPVSRRITWVGTSQVATSFGRKLNIYEQFTSGGAGQLSAFRYQEFHANTMVTAGTGLIFHAPPVRRFSVYPGLAVLYEIGRFDLGELRWQTHHSATTGVFFPTPIGAAGLAVSFNEHGKARFRLSLGTLWR